MKKRKRYSFLLIGISIVLLGPISPTQAQGIFAYRTALDPVPADGFYQIALPPELISKCRPDMGDLRLLGPGNRFVSYALKDSQEARVPTEDMAIPVDHMAQKDSSDKHSYLTVTFPGAYGIDWIGLVIHNPAFFKRRLQVLAQGPDSAEWVTVADFDIDPAKKLFRIPTVKTHRLHLDIANADNAPLEIDKVVCYQTSRFLVAWLQAGHDYRLFTGNTNATPPDYDLKYFTDSLKTTPHTLFIHSIQPIGKEDQPMVIMPTKTAREATTGKNGSGLLLWCCLLAVLLFLIYFSVRMVKAITKKDAHDRI
jgi:hypothetical protein